MTGPLAGVRIVELAGLAPGPFGCMVLADLGADVIRVDRPERVTADAIRADRPEQAAADSIRADRPEQTAANAIRADRPEQTAANAIRADRPEQTAADRPLPPADGPLHRNRRTTMADLKSAGGLAALLRLVDHADVLVEGHRPGVAERLGFGPEVCRARNPGLVYARMTGWGQDGPMAGAAGHDIDYIALAGALEPLGRAGASPQAPMNLLGDFAGGGMLLAVGVLAALLERARSGIGQVVDVAMVDGSALLTSFLHGMIGAGLWSQPRGENLLDGGAPFYDTYRTADGGFMAVGALEPPFYAALLRGLGLDRDPPAQHDPAGWPAMRRQFAQRFAQRSRAEWSQVFAELDACVVPVLSPTEAPDHPHNRARGTFIAVGGAMQPAPAPRFARTPASGPRPPDKPVDVDEIVREWSGR